MNKKIEITIKEKPPCEFESIEELKRYNTAHQIPETKADWSHFMDDPTWSNPLQNGWSKTQEKEQSHFEDDPTVISCLDPSHNPPTHLYIPYGKIYVHICPKCRRKVVLRPPQINY